MPAPTALQRAPEVLAEDTTPHDAPQTATDNDTDIIAITTDHNQEQAQTQPTSEPSQDLPTSMQLDPLTSNEEHTSNQPESLFSPETSSPTAHRREERTIRVPPHRMTPLKQQWPKIYPPLVEHLGLQVRMNIAKKSVELRTSKHTDAKSPSSASSGTGAAQKGADFLQAFMLGFDLDDAIALLRLDDLYIQSFEIKDVKTLNGEHLSRAIGRIAGKDGKTKFAIENASRTRVVLADQKVHILGGFKNIGIAREAVVSLILGTPPGKVYGNLRTVGARMKERF